MKGHSTSEADVSSVLVAARELAAGDPLIATDASDREMRAI